MRDIGIGVIGTAFMGKAHSIAYSVAGTAFGGKLRPSLEMLCDHRIDVAEEKAKAMGFAGFTSNYMDVINNPQIEIISICVPNAVHKEIAMAALTAGKHVWCEKPMSTNLEDSSDMASAAKQYPNQKTIVGYNYTQNPLVKSARELIVEGLIGTVTGFFGVYDVDNEADPERPFSWRMSREMSGSGANADVMCHLVSVAHFITGSKIKRLVSDYATVYPDRMDPKTNTRAKVDNDDVCMVISHFADGLKGSLRVSRVAWGRKCGLSWEVHGSKGMIRYDQERMNELQVFVKEEDPRVQGFKTILSGPYHKPYDAFLPNAGHSLGYVDVKACELNELLNGISSDTPIWPTFQDGLEIERVLDAIDQSALSHQWVAVENGD